MDENLILEEYLILLKQIGFEGLTYRESYKWFREKYGLTPTIVPLDKNKWKLIIWQTVYLEQLKEHYNSYFEAELAGLKKMLDIVTQKQTK